MAQLYVRETTPQTNQSGYLAQSLHEIARRAKIEKMLSPSDADWLNRRISNFRRGLRAYNRKCSFDGPARHRSACNRLLSSFDARVSCIAEVVINGRYEGVDRLRFSKSVLTELAEQVNLFVPLSGSASIVGIPKTNGEIRPTLNFSGNVRAASSLVGYVVRAQGIADDANFSRPGGGTRKAVNSIVCAVEEGFDHWLSLDFAHNFPSVKRPHLTWLSLPQQVISNVLFANEYIYINGYNQIECIKPAVRQGLPQGAAVSGQIASALIGRMLEQVISSEFWRVSYGDDVVIGARSLSQIERLAKAIKGSFENHPAGPLTFSKFDLTHATDCIEFAGYRLRRSRQKDVEGNYTIWCDPNEKSQCRFRFRLREKIAKLLVGECKFLRADTYAKDWCRSFGISEDRNIEWVRAYAAILASEC